MGKELLGKNVDFSITDPEDDTLVELEGCSSFVTSKDYTDTDTTTNDEDGNGASLPTRIDRDIEFEFKRLEEDNGELVEGQQVLSDLSDELGHTSVIPCELSTPNITLSFDAWVELDTPLDTTHEDHATGSGTININGELTKSETTA